MRSDLTEETTVSQTRRSSGWLSALVFFGAVAAVVAAIIWVYPQSPGQAGAESTNTTTTPAVDVSFVPGEEPIADAAEVILPAVVHIQTSSGLGSGVIYDSSGLIITAAHVVEGSETVRVRFSDGEQVTGTVVGRAPEVDIAVIQVERDGLPTADFSTEKPRVGQMAIAVGSPWGLESTVTAGIISAVDQTNCSSDTCSSMVQTDAAINPGNSGGALVDRSGEVVGINVSIFSSSGANDGVGFAVPADIAIAYADAIVSGEPLQTPFFGVQGDDVNTEGQAGAVITAVVDGSGAEAAGIQVDDVVVEFDRVPVLGWGDLIAQVRAHQPGETVEVGLLRDGEQITVEVTLGINTEPVG
ncbi:MAG TPA: trypsin-like peptidase domain-containing protein [Acidimicrobiia bacterium]|nr:trypsin-like peptidase domain-containing protein [Acidimicrobiia bacterium]